ncbi:MAG TPA: PaaI family thioesterase [Streptosporangiaceae bacterium]|nr:PaaI family thioesterase [Streptosporangiaceae bacterium]
MAESSAAAGPGLSHYPVAGSPATGEDPALTSRRAAISELGDALRALVEAAAATEVPEVILRQVAPQVREATAALSQQTRKRADLPSSDDLLGGYRMYNPVTGRGSALAPPLDIERDGTQVTGTCTLGLAFEGPPSYAHGGVSATLLDQLLGYAASAAGHPGMTVTLELRYRAPVPLQTPLRLTAEAGEADGRRITAHGVITTAAEPDKVLVEATGVFVGLRPEQAARLFRAVQPDATDPLVAHD